MTVPSNVPGFVPSAVPSKKRANTAAKAGVSPMSLAPLLFGIEEKREEREGESKGVATKVRVQCVSPRDGRDSKPLTADAFRRRIERAFRAVEFSRDNPFRAIIAERIESGRAEFAAEVAEAKAASGCEF